VTELLTTACRLLDEEAAGVDRPAANVGEQLALVYILLADDIPADLAAEWVDRHRARYIGLLMHGLAPWEVAEVALADVWGT
jgi:hypothetical protein